ncbi:MAG: hypothetical protein KAT46_03030, partial [Deltaproteobacteria bacterium]|nr:hypothetical protein [Deltaproteobacteria bacterium]
MTIKFMKKIILKEALPLRRLLRLSVVTSFLLLALVAVPIVANGAQGSGYYYGKGGGYASNNGGGYSNGNGNGNGYGDGYSYDQPVILKSIAILPFENLSGVPIASDMMMDGITSELKSKGWLLIAWKDAVEEFLAKRRVRYTGAITRLVVREMGKVLGVDAVMVGSVNYYSGKDGSIVVGMSCRLVSTLNGSIIWTDNLTYTGRDFEGILGLGAVKSIEILSSMVVKDLIKSIEDRFFMRDTALNPFEIERVITYPPIGKGGEKIDLRIKILPLMEEPRQVRVIVDGIEVVLEKVGLGEYEGFVFAPEQEGVYSLDVIALDRAMMPYPFEAVGKIIVDSTPPPVNMTLSQNIFSLKKRGSVTFDTNMLEYEEIDEWEMKIYDTDDVMVRSDRGYGLIPKKFKWSGEMDSRKMVEDGDYRCEFVAKDKAGNITTINNMVTVKSVPPEVKVEVDFDEEGGVVFSFVSDSDDIIESWQFTVTDRDGNVVKTVDGEGTIPETVGLALEDGLRVSRLRFEVTAKDVAGNEFVMSRSLPALLSGKTPFAGLNS